MFQQLNPFAVSGLLIAIAYLPLFLFIFIKGKTKLARIYSLHIFSVFVWGVGSFLIGISKNLTFTLTIWPIALIGVCYIPVFFLHSVLIITKHKSKILIFLTYLQALFFTLAIIKNLAINDPFLLHNEFYWINGTKLYHFSFIVWALLCTIAHIQLINHYRICYPAERNQLTFLFLSIIGFIGGATNFLPTFGIHIYPYGNFLVPIHSLVVTYAILKHQFLDITFAVKKGIVYSILITLVALFYFSTIFIFERFLQNFVGYKSLFISIIMAFLLGIILIPLRNRIQRFVDYYFFQATPEEMFEQRKLLLNEVQKSEKYKTLGVFSSGIAHELKNPLTTIKTFTDYLPKNLDNKEFLKKFSTLVGGEVDRMDDMVHQLLDYARPAPLNLQPTDIHKLLDNTIESLSINTLQHRIEVVRNFDAGKGFLINADPNQLRQALINVLLNSIDAMPEGGVLKIGTRIKGDSNPLLEISIRDTGLGMSKEDLGHIFDPFFTKKDNGTGLGLPITMTIIQKHGGNIIVNSAIKAGTEVIFELPMGEKKQRQL